MLGPGSSSQTQENAEGMLSFLASHGDVIAACGAIPLLVPLLNYRSTTHMTAVAALSSISESAGTRAAIAAAGAIPPLVRMLGLDLMRSSNEVRLAAGVLLHLALDADLAVTVALAHAIPPPLKLLGSAASDHRVLHIASTAIASLARNVWCANAIAIAGAVPRLVHLLRPDFPGLVQQRASAALSNLAYVDGDAIKDTIAAAGAIPPLVQLLGRCDCPAALTTLAMLFRRHAVAVVAAGAIPRLVMMLAPCFSPDEQHDAVRALRSVAVTVEIAATIVGAGAIPPLVRPLRPNSPLKLRENAARALRTLSCLSRGAGAIAEAGGIPLLVQLMVAHGSDPSAARRALLALSDSSPASAAAVQAVFMNSDAETLRLLRAL